MLSTFSKTNNCVLFNPKVKIWKMSCFKWPLLYFPRISGHQMQLKLFLRLNTSPCWCAFFMVLKLHVNSKKVFGVFLRTLRISSSVRTTGVFSCDRCASLCAWWPGLWSLSGHPGLHPGVPAQFRPPRQGSLAAWASASTPTHHSTIKRQRFVLIRSKAH